jgi:OB-fold nucleic acid binding domain
VQKVFVADWEGVLAAHRQEISGQGALGSVPETGQSPNGVSLGELMASVAEAIQTKFNGLVWVRAEISQLRPIKGDHYAIELVEHDPDGKMVARVQAFMWRGSASKLIAKFRLATAGDLNAGIKVMLSVKTEFSATHGIRLVIQDIDPAYTLGDIQAKLKQIRETLSREAFLAGTGSCVPPASFAGWRWSARAGRLGWVILRAMPIFSKGMVCASSITLLRNSRGLMRPWKSRHVCWVCL